MASNVLLLAFCLFLAIPITAKSRAAKKIEKTEDAEDSALRLDAEDNQVERKKWQLSRQRRFVTGICTTVVGCLGTIIKLFPIRINFRLRAIYNRLKGRLHIWFKHTTILASYGLFRCQGLHTAGVV